MKYKYKLETKAVIHTGITTLFNNDWVATTGSGQMVINAGYAWNGCNPSLSVLDLFWIGTPEGIVGPDTAGKPITYQASLVHDVLIQFNVIPRKEADRIFYKLLKQANFKLAWLYYGVVRVVSFFKRLKKVKS
jgi:hypothetical protein